MWNIIDFSEERADEVMRKVFIKPNTYIIEDKQSGVFSGYLSLFVDVNGQGEFALRLRQETDIQEAVGFLGNIMANHIKAEQKSLTMQFNLE